MDTSKDDHMLGVVTMVELQAGIRKGIVQVHNLDTRETYNAVRLMDRFVGKSEGGCPAVGPFLHNRRIQGHDHRSTC
ncbi:MAG: hypothetical protein CL678_15945 [Bdellovibrionaceae bacterium]|nr:hypothetical protein [Pseudobdellovibrionaceae bacterium]